MDTTPQGLSNPGHIGFRRTRADSSTVDRPPMRHLGHSAVALHPTQQVPTTLGFAAEVGGFSTTLALHEGEIADGRRRGSRNYIGILWQNAVVSPSAVSDLCRAIVARLGAETTDVVGVGAAGVLLAKLLDSFSDHAPAPLFVSLVWGWSFPVVTMALRGPHEGEPYVRCADELVGELVCHLEDPLAREHRVVAAPSTGVRAVVVLDLVRRI